MSTLPLSSHPPLACLLAKQNGLPLIMAILNVTPDSFSDGGKLSNTTALLIAAEKAVNAGANILDVGGESTRPGASQVPTEEEIERVTPAIEAIRHQFPTVPISIDTRKAAVASAAIAAGATMVNDVSGLRYDSAMLGVIATHPVDLLLMHSAGTPQTMQQNPHYPEGVVPHVCHFLQQAATQVLQAGVSAERIWIDPGFGFGKTIDHNLELLAALPKLAQLGFPLAVGLSRKSFLTLGQAETIPPTHREPLTAAAHAIAIQAGVGLLRLHDVATQAPVLRWLQAYQQQATGTQPKP